MGFKKGQAKPPGSGRKGNGQSPNKKTLYGQERILGLLDEYSSSGLMAADFMSLEPKDRLYLAEKLTQYVVPKRQSVDADVSVGPQRDEVVMLLEELSDGDE